MQKKIFEIQKKYNLSCMVNFWAADGYHILGSVKNNFFQKGIAFEKGKKCSKTY